MDKRTYNTMDKRTDNAMDKRTDNTMDKRTDNTMDKRTDNTMDKRTNDDIRNTTHKTKDRATRTLLRTRCKNWSSGRVISSCSTCDTLTKMWE
jgi:hypothetical protein